LTIPVPISQPSDDLITDNGKMEDVFSLSIPNHYEEWLAFHHDNPIQKFTKNFHVRKMEWMGVRPLGMGFMAYKGLYCLIYGCLCRGCVASSSSMQPFSMPIYSPLIN
jgi:hypothetical protein